MRDIALSTSSDQRTTATNRRVWQVTQRALGYMAMIAVILIIGIPVAWVLSGALKTNREIFSTTPQLLPLNPNFDNFGKAWRAAPFDRFYLNSFITTLLGAGAEIIMAVTTAYALVFVRFPKRDWVFVLLLLALMVPEEVVLVPNYLTIAGWRMVNTYPGIVLPGASIAFGTFLLRQYFRTLPLELIDAARVDGAGHLRTLLSVVVPVAAPAVATTALLSITAKWNEYLWPLLITTTEDMRTLPVGISRLLDQEGNTEWGVVMAATLFVIVPVMLIFLYAQRFVVDGIAAGAVKG
ncbi:MAG: carbohydrate ABC transporter permease [Anaerolineae bacterium]|nr:carbohydrate ABC transporter permease [Anaerolineae bacterium]